MPTSIRQQILDWNREQAALFSAQSGQRRQWFDIHSTCFGFLGCMDGRVNLSVSTETPLGIFMPWRNMGGKFDIGQLSFGESLKAWLVDVEGGSREAVLFITYHWSRGDLHRGCRGFDYDTSQAIKAMRSLRDDIAEVFAGSRLRPILLGMETDCNALVVHGETGEEEFDISQIGGNLEEDLTLQMQGRLTQMFKGMSGTMIFDLATLLEGNRRHILKVKGRPPEALKHGEKILALGRGFDWINGLNEAIIVGPYSDNISEPVVTAARILIQNKQEGRIQNQKVVLLTCMPYTDKSRYYRNLAKKRALYLAKIALAGIRRELPEHAGFFVPMVVVINMGPRILEEIDLTGIPEFADFVE